MYTNESISKLVKISGLQSGLSHRGAAWVFFWKESALIVFTQGHAPEYFQMCCSSKDFYATFLGVGYLTIKIHSLTCICELCSA